MGQDEESPGRTGDPAPDPETGRWDGREIAAWRASVGVSQADLASSMSVARPYVVRLEQDASVSPAAGRKMVLATRRIVAVREKLMRDGTAALESIRQERGR